MCVGVLNTRLAVITEKWRNSVKNKNQTKIKTRKFTIQSKVKYPILYVDFNPPNPHTITTKKKKKMLIRPDVSQILSPFILFTVVKLFFDLICLHAEIFHENYCINESEPSIS